MSLFKSKEIEREKAVKYAVYDCRSKDASGNPCSGKVYYEYDSAPVPASVKIGDPSTVEGTFVYLTCNNPDTQHQNKYFIEKKSI